MVAERAIKYQQKLAQEESVRNQMIDDSDQVEAMVKDEGKKEEEEEKKKGMVVPMKKKFRGKGKGRFRRVGKQSRLMSLDKDASLEVIREENDYEVEALYKRGG